VASATIESRRLFTLNERETSSLNDDVKDRWNRVADFWNERMGDDGNVFHRALVGPSQERLLDLKRDELVVEVACGNGQFTRRMAELGARVVASDGASRMIENARARSAEYADRIEFSVIDVTDAGALMSLGERRFDAAVCTMALFDIADIEPLVKSLSRLLKVGGRFVFTVLHPCFNSVPDLQMVAEKDFVGGIETHYSLKFSRYITPSVDAGLAMPDQPVASYVMHRPLSLIFNTCFAAGFVLDGIEEPVFGDETPARGTISWDDLREIPPVLAARMRLPA
jgi:2-polyprenyl-3-methyl-5-hydroxy-6-metoxy-1,4-benzoquinol methylase